MPEDKKVVCSCCGAMLTIDPEQESEDYLACLPFTGIEKDLPTGKLTPIVGEPVYVDVNGDKMTREAFMKAHNIDPEIAYQKMRESMVNKPRTLRVGR